MSGTNNAPGRQERLSVTAGQDEIENGDHFDNLEDADTLADLSNPAIDSVTSGASPMDSQPDGGRQLTTDSDALDTGLNDSDLGSAEAGLSPVQQADPAGREGYAGLEPDVSQTAGTGDRATGVTGLRG